MSFIYYTAKSTGPLSASEFGKILSKERITFEQWVRLEPETIANACLKDIGALQNWADFYIEQVGKSYHAPVFHEFAAEFENIELEAVAMQDFILMNLHEPKVKAYLKRSILAYFEARKINGHPRDLTRIWPYLNVFADHPPAPNTLFPQIIHRHDNSKSLRVIVTPHTRSSIEELMHYRNV